MNYMDKKSDILVLQRFYYNFREGFFDILYEKNPGFLLINSVHSLGRVKVGKTKNKRYIIQTFCLHFGENIILFPFLFLKLIKINPSIIVTEGGQNTINNIFVLFYSKLFNKKYIIWDLGRGYYNPRTNLLRSIYMTIYKIILNNASLVYTYNSMSKKYFQSLNISNSKILILNNTIDTSKIIDKKAICNKNEYIQYIESLHNIIYNKNITYFSFIGTLIESKNIESMSEILNLLGNSYHLFIIGSGNNDYTEKLKSIFRNNNCTFVGSVHQNELFPYMKLSSFSILPGLGGLSINLSMAYGVPVLCRHADGAEFDLIFNNKTGYIYSSEIEAVEYILSKNTLDWVSMGKNALDLIKQDFTISKQYEKFICGINQVKNQE